MTDDLVNHPQHYIQGTIECIDAIVGLGLPYLEGTSFWYANKMSKRVEALTSEEELSLPSERAARNDEIFARQVASGASAALGVIASVIIVPPLGTVIKIHLAPRVYILEYLKDFL